LKKRNRARNGKVERETEREIKTDSSYRTWVLSLSASRHHLHELCFVGEGGHEDVGWLSRDSRRGNAASASSRKEGDDATGLPASTRCVRDDEFASGNVAIMLRSRSRCWCRKKEKGEGLVPSA